MFKKYNKAPFPTLPGSEKEFIEAELRKIQAAINSMEGSTGGGSGNIDGGTPSTNYGGLTPVDGGGV